MKKSNRWFIICLILIIALTGCGKGTERIKSIRVYKMEDYKTVQEGSQITFTKAKEISEFTEAFAKAKKMGGLVNMAEPKYKVKIGNNEYFLWITEENGTIMNVKDTHTISILSKDSAKKVYALLN